MEDIELTDKAEFYESCCYAKQKQKAMNKTFDEDLRDAKRLFMDLATVNRQSLGGNKNWISDS